MMADGGSGGSGNGNNGNNGSGNGGNGKGENNNNGGSGNGNNNGDGKPAIDYNRIEQIIAGRLGATEESVLKGYFKDQGLTAEEMADAIKGYKDRKASSTPNIDELNAQIKSANDATIKAQINLEAYKMASTLGADPKNVEYVIKLADMSDVVKDGKISSENLQKALEKVLTDVPAFKATADGGNGFKGKVGSEGGGNEGDPDLLLKKAMGLA